jgi:ABC-type glycerol-3-phosphate transport system substrate-binding protein
LYRNASIIPEAPVNWDDLIGKASASTTGDITGMVFETGVYFSAGHLYALGGQLLDEYSGEPLFLDDHGVEWMVLMQNVKNAGLPVVNYSEDDADGFRDGKTGMVIDGNWNAQSMAEAVGVPNLVIDEWPQGMSGFVQAELISLVNDPDMDKNEEVASIAFMEFLASEQAQMIWADVACGNHDLGNGVPVLKDIYIADPLVEMAMRAYSGGVPFPTQPNLVLYWPTVNTAINNVVKYSMDPWDALQSAHDEIRSQLP